MGKSADDKAKGKPTEGDRRQGADRRKQPAGGDRETDQAGKGKDQAPEQTSFGKEIFGEDE